MHNLVCWALYLFCCYVMICCNVVMCYDVAAFSNIVMLTCFIVAVSWSKMVNIDNMTNVWSALWLWKWVDVDGIYMDLLNYAASLSDLVSSIPHYQKIGSDSSPLNISGETLSTLRMLLGRLILAWVSAQGDHAGRALIEWGPLSMKLCWWVSPTNGSIIETKLQIRGGYILASDSIRDRGMVWSEVVEGPLVE